MGYFGAYVLFGWPEKIWSDIRIRYPENSSYDYFTVRLYYPNLIVELNSDTRVARAGPRYEVHGDEASYLKYGFDSQEQQLSDGMVPGDPGFGIDPTLGELYFPAQVQPEIIPNQNGNHLTFYQQLEQAINHNKPLPVTAEQGLDVIRLLKKLEACSGSGLMTL